MPTIARLSALEILDSRGRPTLRATCELVGGSTGTAAVPSGASTGRHEARELRDGDPERYGGLGCRRAVANVTGPIHDGFVGKSFPDQADLDRALLELDGTGDKSRLGANALLGVSLAFARAVAAERGLPLYAHLAAITGAPSPDGLRALPRPTINLFSGGKHAGGQVPIQDVLVVPRQATIDGCLAATYAVFQAAAALCQERYGMRALVADEGGLAPAFEDVETMLQTAIDAIERAGWQPGEEIALAVDVAASHFYEDGRYALTAPALVAAGMVETLAGWAERYPVVSVEDGLAEDDWTHWPALRARLSGTALTLGDDLLCTNPERIRRAIATGAADALLLKVNQVGTLTEALAARNLARDAGWRVVVSARSGETEDDWLTDLAVGWAGDALKVGSITRSERLAKWNRLLAIEATTGLPVAP